MHAIFDWAVTVGALVFMAALIFGEFAVSATPNLSPARRWALRVGGSFLAVSTLLALGVTFWRGPLHISSLPGYAVAISILLIRP